MEVKNLISLFSYISWDLRLRNSWLSLSLSLRLQTRYTMTWRNTLPLKILLCHTCLSECLVLVNIIIKLLSFIILELFRYSLIKEV